MLGQNWSKHGPNTALNGYQQVDGVQNTMLNPIGEFWVLDGQCKTRPKMVQTLPSGTKKVNNQKACP